MEKKNRLAALLWLPLFAISYWKMPQVPPDFALRIEGMFYDEIDTFKRKYSRPGVRRPDKMSVVHGEVMREIIAGDSAVSFDFNQDEKQEIYLYLQKMYYTNYPDNISSKCEHQIVPSHKVELVIRANEMIKHISYEDGCEDETMQSRELRHLVNLLYEMSSRHKAVRQLPETILFDL
jgi:hypothetical protein